MIIRAFELRRGNVFIKQGSYYVVVRVDNESIVYTSWNKNLERNSGTYGRIGVNSQERVEYIGVRPKKKKTKPMSTGKYNPTRKLRPLHHGMKVSYDVKI